MAMWSHELSERLLRAGVAPRHVRRYVTELREHWLDLTAEEERAGRDSSEAAAIGLTRLGQVNDLARVMIERPELRSWTARAPWAVLGAGPVLLLATGWSIALLILYTGWTWFLQDARTPFIPIHGFAIVYFGVGRMLYYGAPLLSGWGTAILAGRQRMRAVWPVVVGLLAVALPGATGTVEVQPPQVPGEAGNVGIRFLPAASHSYQAMVLFVLIALPWVVWRWRSSRAAESSI